MATPSYCLTKSTLLILLWIFLIRLFYDFETHVNGPNWFTPCLFVFYLIYPFVGILADVKFGKLKVALVSAMLALLTAALQLLGNILLDLGINNKVVQILLQMFNGFNQSAMLCFEISITSLGVDQLINAKTSVLTAFIWWRFWIHLLGTLVRKLLICFLEHTDEYIVYVPKGIHIVSVFIVVVSCYVFLNKQTFIRLTTVNPLKLIAHVLNFARKTKYPKHRSALTYWLDDYPPRIDFGKTKYGGPFTEEEVENVKTFFRLLPVLLVTFMVYIPVEPLGRFHSLSSNGTWSIGECLVTSSYFCHYVIAIIFVPVKLIIFNQFRYKLKCFATLIRFIGFGILLSIVGQMILPVFDFLATSSTNETAECLFSDSTNITSNHSKYYFLITDYRILLIPKAISGLGRTFVTPGSFELLVAQSPIEMRGIILGLIFSVMRLYDHIGWYLMLPFKAFPSLRPSCEFYFFILNLVVMVVSLIGVTIIGKWYKLRQRDDPFNPYSAVEDFYDKDFERRDNFYGTLSQRD